MVVVGHVDAGKSTLLGQVLVKMGYVTQARAHCHQCLVQNAALDLIESILQNCSGW